LHDHYWRPSSSNNCSSLNKLTIKVIGELSSLVKFCGAMIKECSGKILRYHESYREAILAFSKSIWALHDFESETDNLNSVSDINCVRSFP